MREDYYKPLNQRVVTQTADGAGSYTESVSDTSFNGYIAMLSGSEIRKNQTIGNQGTARLLTSKVLVKTNRVVDDVGYFSEAGTVFEVTWVYKNPHEGVYYDLRIV